MYKIINSAKLSKIISPQDKCHFTWVYRFERNISAFTEETNKESIL